jgi:uncharacterized protein (TIGR04255 family)
MASGLPDYESPPVIEVAIGVQFAPIEGFSAAHTGLFWDRIRKEYPKVEEQLPLAHVVEPLDTESLPEPSKPVILQKLPQPRIWFLSESGTSIVQVQQDRFHVNWRKLESKEDYPRYDNVKQRFSSMWKKFCEFLRDEHLGSPDIDQCELTYVNFILKGSGWNEVHDVEKIFTTFAWETKEGFLPPPENVGWSMQFKMRDGSGRLHTEVQRVLTMPRREEAMRFVLTARGCPVEKEEKNIKKWFDVSREWIVRGFSDLTGRFTDKLWGRKDDR